MIDLDRSLRRWADVVERETKTDHRTAAGAGAAGGVGFAALAVLRAQMQPGIDVILDRIELDRHLQTASRVVTGEGSLDRQSLRGKAAVGVCRRASGYGVPTFAVAGVSALAPPKFVPQDSPDVYRAQRLGTRRCALNESGCRTARRGEREAGATPDFVDVSRQRAGTAHRNLTTTLPLAVRSSSEAIASAARSSG